jgi:hypothetical protein
MKGRFEIGRTGEGRGKSINVGEGLAHNHCQAEAGHFE